MVSVLTGQSQTRGHRKDTGKVDLWISKLLGRCTWGVWGVAGELVKGEPGDFHLCIGLVQEE